MSVAYKLAVVGGAFLAMAFGQAAWAETTCYGEGAYRVCTTVIQHADGSISASSRDSMGNTYDMSTEVETSRSGDTRVTSRDSEGNSYEIRTYTDSRGTHSVDSEGNSCTITNTGRMIGCE